MLVNLGPASPEVIARGDNLTSALGKFASLLWLFNVDRLGGAASRSTSTSGRIVLHDVAFVLPAYELQSLRLLLNATGSFEASAHPLAPQFLITQLNKNQVIQFNFRAP